MSFVIFRNKLYFLFLFSLFISIFLLFLRFCPWSLSFPRSVRWGRAEKILASMRSIISWSDYPVLSRELPSSLRRTGISVWSPILSQTWPRFLPVPWSRRTHFLLYPHREFRKGSSGSVLKPPPLPRWYMSIRSSGIDMFLPFFLFLSWSSISPQWFFK